MTKKFRFGSLILGVAAAASLAAGCGQKPAAGGPTAAPPARSTPVAAAPDASATSDATADASATVSGSPVADASVTPGESGTPGADNIYTYESGGVQFAVPDGWKDEKQGEEAVIIGPEDGSMAVIIWAPEEQDITKAAETVDQILGQFVTDVQVQGEAEEGDANGMKTMQIVGSGKSEGKDTAWAAQFVQGSKLIVFLAVAEAENLEKHGPALDQLDSSIKPL